MRLLVLAVAIFVSGLLFGVGGCLAIDTPDGALKCSTVPQRACPEGFYCLADSNTCWRYGKFPADMAEPGGFFPGGDQDMSVPVGDDLSMSSPDDLSSTD